MGERGPVHELDAGLYRAVVRNGVPMIERDNEGSAVTAVFVPVTPPLLSELRSEWSRPLQFMVDPSGEFVFRDVATPAARCPLCECEPPALHLGTCALSFMRTGRALVVVELPPFRQSLSPDSASFAGSGSDRS